jgi:hypothetical protein
MRLIEKKDQMRRDFTGVYECEGCGFIKEIYGCYDDDYFHTQVMPDRDCDKCGKSTNSLGVKKERVLTRYPEGEQH